MIYNGISNAFTSSIRKMTAKAELYNGSALAKTFTPDGDLVSFTIDRTSDSKFFGFGIGQKVNVKIRNVENAYSITTDNHFKISIGDTNYNKMYTMAPLFYVTEVHKDRVTNELSVTAYDVLYRAANHTLDEIEPAPVVVDGETTAAQPYIHSSYTIGEFATACGAFLGVEVELPELEEFNLYYETGANFEGTETIREALDDIAEATQTFYFINYQNKLKFKRSVIEASEYTIFKDNYIDLSSKTNRRLSAICSTNELGDAITASLDQTGTTQFIRDNAFWDLREDRATLVENALAAVGGNIIGQFECSWRGNPLVEPGDHIYIKARDGGQVQTYLFNDTLTFDGGLHQKSSWEYPDEDEGTAANPSSLGEVLKKTYAKVDKQEQRIDLVVTDTDEKLSQLTVDMSGISATVSRVETVALESLDAINGELAEINKQVSATMSAEEIEFLVSKTINTGVESVETTTGFTFDEEGLTISKSDSNISTTITEDGMKIKKGSTEVLTADNGGVKAIDLHATTYLLIGTNSRFEDYNSSRTGCFWIGG